MSVQSAALPPSKPLVLGPRSRSRTRLPSFVALATVATVATAGLTLVSPQFGASAALVGLVAAAYAGHPATGLATLWAVWLLTPGLRRVLGLETGYVGSDPLAVAPFAACAAVAGLALFQVSLSRQAKLVLVAAGLGLVLGLPSAVGNPAAAAFGGLAYASALSAMVIGWSEGRRPVGSWSLSRALAIGGPLLGVYALVQYFADPPPWDAFWLQSVNFVSIGAPEEGKIRVFSTLNSPAVLALVCALAVIVYLARRRVNALSLAGLTLVVVTLALTYVRGAWVALVIGLLALAVVRRGRVGPQFLAVVVVAGLAGLALNAGDGALDAFFERAGTLGDLDSDVSATERTETASQLLPAVLNAPFGYGLGSAGEATRLSGEGLRNPDNGYLSLAYQVGVPGAILLLVGPVVAMWTSARTALRRDGERTAAALVAALALFLALLLTGDYFYGLPGVILWYLIGAALVRQNLGEDQPATPRHSVTLARRGPRRPYWSPEGTDRPRATTPSARP